MANPYTLFEVSWEVCNKVGGIHTVLSTKAQTMVNKLGDDYIAIGPWLLSDHDREVPFQDDRAYDDFAESCRQMGIPVRVGRWQIPGQPRTILVEFSRLFEEKDALLGQLWEEYQVDSISGGWDYFEPVLFGHAAGRVIERWWEENLAGEYRRSVAHAHEWMTASALLYLKKNVPSIGTVFTTHATMLGRSLSSLGHSPEDGLGGQTAAELAEQNGVVSKHSIEGISAREADAFTTVSEITAAEATLLHERRPNPILPNGIDLEVVDQLAGETTREEARRRLLDTTSRFLGQNLDDALLLCISGRYEFHNKGIDLLLDAAKKLNEKEGRRAVFFILVPAGNSGIKSELLGRLDQPLEEIDGPLGFTTHNLFDSDDDPVQRYCAEHGLENTPDARIQIVHIPIYLRHNDGFLNLPYEAVLRAMDLSCFPSYYEPWGYTPQESLAVGVPTITSDYAGFGRWAQSEKLGPKDGLTVLPRVHVQHDKIVSDFVTLLEGYLEQPPDPAAMVEVCRRTASKTSWTDLISRYEEAYSIALDSVQTRLESGVPQSRRRRQSIAVQPTPDGQKPRLLEFDVAARLPEPLRPLERLARNFWWSWDPEGIELFQELSPLSWRASGHNPTLFLQRIYPQDIEAKANDPAYLAKLERVIARFDTYLNEDPKQGAWKSYLPSSEEAYVTSEHPVAYFCAEYGLHESLCIYSGGLGILAGDHLKSASDLNLPLVAVGLFYSMGYMAQRISPAGEQVAEYAENDPRTLPLERVTDEQGRPLEIALQLPGRELFLAAWRVRVGRVTLYLLDANLPSNRQEDRDITRNLYGGEEETRIQQEIVLGRGGVRLLWRLGIQPAVYHMNEGHAAFLTLERVGQLAHKEGLTFDEAREYVKATTLFTTHTPVPAGHDRFGEDLMRRYFSDVPEWVGVPWDRFYALGQSAEETDSFNMTYLALNFAAYCNGVSQLHAVVSRGLLQPKWPGLLQSEVPVDGITNGIHLATWTHPSISRALGATDRAVQGYDFSSELGRRELTELWNARRRLKTKLIEHVAETLERKFVERHDSPQLLGQILDGLTDEALVIGFARRFAPYKRAHLLFQDPERLGRILNDRNQPVIILVAGKAHPRDQHGQDILKAIVERTRETNFAGRVFRRNYDIDVARYLVQGVDVWLNNPTRTLEASGTSGMKVSANGGLNLSIADGWWPEAFDGNNGWRIADDRVYSDQALQDQFDGVALYRLLEEEVVPCYFERDADGIPWRWMAMVRNNLTTIPTVFNTDRMVGDYIRRAYHPLGTFYQELSQDKKNSLKLAAQEKQRLSRGFRDVKILSADVGELTRLHVGDPVDVHVELELGELTTDDVLVELVFGHKKGDLNLDNMTMITLNPTGEVTGGTTVYEGSHPMERSGHYGYGIRVRLRPTRFSCDSLSHLVLWA